MKIMKTFVGVFLVTFFIGYVSVLPTKRTPAPVKLEKVDLYMDFYNYEKGGFSSGLFLSSEAGKGELVKGAAAFGALGW